MSHEINDNVQKPTEVAKGDNLNLLSVNEGDKTSTQGIEATSKALEANEAAIEAVRAAIEKIAQRAAALGLSSEPHHYDTMKECCEKGAAAGEPAYLELQKHMKK